jgi:hypothetical protein
MVAGSVSAGGSSTPVMLTVIVSVVVVVPAPFTAVKATVRLATGSSALFEYPISEATFSATDWSTFEPKT